MSSLLKDRYNIILTKNHTQEIEDICNFPSLERIFKHIEEIKDNFGEVFIIGGATVYEQCLRKYPEQLNKLYISEIDDDWLGNEDSKYFDYCLSFGPQDIEESFKREFKSILEEVV